MAELPRPLPRSDPRLGARRRRLERRRSIALALSLLPMLPAESAGMMIFHFIVFGAVFGALLPMRAAATPSWDKGWAPTMRTSAP